MTKTIIIDPGHGGTDPGANGFGVNEKDWTLKISLYQYGRLKELGVAVAITRTSDKTLDSVSRTNLIKDKYDYCMSNHFNAYNGSARGIETIHSIYSNNAIAIRLADIIVATSKLPLRRVFNRRGKAGDYYFMHRLTGSTHTIIVEYGFIDNKEDHDYYKNEGNFYKVAESVVKEWCAILGVEYVVPNKSVSKPSKPTQAKENLKVDGYLGKLTISALQRYFGTIVDGVISKPSLVIKALQKLLSVTQDGYLGPITIRAMQKRFGTVQDGIISKPSLVIKELQKRLNKGKL